jgi:DNA-directed RNA polymerase specialized sigma24 family protein
MDIERVDNILDSRNAVVLMYRILEKDRDKFIIMACLQLNYSQEEVGRMLGTSQENISKRLKRARQLLKLQQEEVIL